MKVCEIWEDLEHPDNDYIFKYDRMLTPEEHAKLIKKIIAKYCKSESEKCYKKWVEPQKGEEEK